ncbi:MAG: UPF0104 family protein [Geodermatophilales bacterium]|nr:UPF0104 family protein [Geodermatophilales bacterium]
MTSTEDPAPPERQQRPLWRRVLGPAFSVALLVAVFVWFLPKFTSITDVWTSVLSMSWLQVAVLLVAAVWNLATYQFVVLSTMPGLTFPQATVSTETTTAVANTVVGGSAIFLGLTYAMNTSWGFSRSRTSVSLLVSGLFNNFAKLGLPVFAVAWLAFSGTPTAGRLLTGVAGVAGLVAAVVALWLLLRSRESAAWLGRGLGLVASAVLRPFGRPPVQGWDRALAKFRDRTVLLLHARWYWIALATLVSHLSLFLVLLLALRFVGVDAAAVTAAEALAVFAFARLLTAIPFTPGGLGVVEFALITGLAAAGGPRAMVAAAVLIFRALTYVLPIPLGLVTYVIWQRKKSWRRAPNSAPRTELVPETV